MAVQQKSNPDQTNKAAPKQRPSDLDNQDPGQLLEQVEPLAIQRAVHDPGRARPADVLALQRVVGNRAVGHLIQPKLTVGPVGDEYEQEADRVADQVMSMPSPQRQEEEKELQMQPLAASIMPIAQRQEMEEEELMAKPLQRQEMEEEELMAKPLRRQEMEEEELMAKPLQRQEMEEEELMAKPLQRQEMEEEELMAKPLQRQEMEEEELMAKPLQRQEMEEEELMAKPLQRQEMEEEELMAKPLQRQEMEEEELMAKPLQRQEMEEEELMAKPLQRQEMEEEELMAKPLAQRQGQSKEEEEPVQAKSLLQKAADDGSFEAGDDVESRLDSLKGQGAPLPDDTRTDMEARFGANFDGVRVHAGTEATQLNRRLQAQAFTHGRDIYFGSGKYDPGSSGGQRLLAHELTHVVQQTGGQLRRKFEGAKKVVGAAGRMLANVASGTLLPGAWKRAVTGGPKAFGKHAGKEAAEGAYGSVAGLSGFKSAKERLAEKMKAWRDKQPKEMQVALVEAETEETETPVEPALNPEQRAELRRLYKKLVLRLHPDRHSTESENVKRYYTEKFKEMKAAYDKGDLNRMQELMQEEEDRLKKGKPEEVADVQEELQGKVSVERYKELAANLTPDQLKELFKAMRLSNLGQFATLYNFVPEEKQLEMTNLLQTEGLTGDWQLELTTAKSEAMTEQELLVNEALRKLSPPREIVPIEGDGDCFYNSLRTTAGIEKSVSDLRALVAVVISHNREKILSSGLLAEGALNTMLQAITQAGQWNNRLGDLVPPVMQMILGGTEITIHASNGVRSKDDVGAWELPPDFETLHATKTPIILAYVGSNHYHATKEIDQPKTELALVLRTED